MRSRFIIVTLCAFLTFSVRSKSSASAPATQPTLLMESVGQLRASGMLLNDVVNQLQQATGQNILVNWGALAQEHVTRDLPVTIDLSHLSLSEALIRLLDHVAGSHARLGYSVDNNVLVITTSMELSKNVVTRVYDIRAGIKSGKDVATIIRRIRGVEPLSWHDTGGFGSIDRFDGQLIVTQTPDVQHRIAEELQRDNAGIAFNN